MNNKLTIIMYHYVRALKDSRFPNIKGLDLDLFVQQLAYIDKHYQVITMEQVFDYFEAPGKFRLPENPILLTFDDGYIDHFTNVFPILVNRGWQGSFFISAKPLKEQVVLDVNKIHFILASADMQMLLSDIFKLLGKCRDEGCKIDSDEILFQRLAVANRWDNKETIFVKRLLQNELDEAVRKSISNQLFEKYLGMKESMFSKELYMNKEQIRCMKKAGMFLGLHGYDHYWLGKLKEQNMKADIDRSLEYFDGIIDRSRWVMNYPYGSVNNSVIEYIKMKGCSLALTVDARIADLSIDNKYLLPRYDTNDLPPKGRDIF